MVSQLIHDGKTTITITELCVSHRELSSDFALFPDTPAKEASTSYQHALILCGCIHNPVGSTNFPRHVYQDKTYDKQHPHPGYSHHHK